MISTLLVVFLLWLPLATVLRGILRGSYGVTFSNKGKMVIYIVLAAPALYANWLIELLAKNSSIVDKLSKVGDWFES